jgi:hypothetical protein
MPRVGMPNKTLPDNINIPKKFARFISYSFFWLNPVAGGRMERTAGNAQ